MTGQPNIDVGPDKDTQKFSCFLFKGSSLEDFVRAQSHLQMKVLWDICDQGLHALRHIHQQSITHHDVKRMYIQL